MPTKRIILFALLLAAFLTAGSVAFSQTREKHAIGGVVTDLSTSEPVFMSSVVVKELGLWASTGDDGKFVIEGITAGKYTVEIVLLGYETRTMTLDVNKDILNLNIKLSPSNLSLKEVVVTAREGGELTSSSKIGKTTIEHVQPSSLRDVMQLLPGNVTENPNLTSVNAISIRDIGTNSANALGTALVVDGASVSNDANLQMMSSGTAINSDVTNAASTAGGGADARQISTDNIESVEVIRGIPSVVYGDLTSGAVVVKTKAGVTPWEVRLKTDPHLKQVSFGKGFSISEKAGVMNFDADYAHAYSDIRTPSSAYNRVNFQAGYSNAFLDRKLTFNAKLHLNWSNATNRSDSDLVLDEVFQQRDWGARLNVNGRWILNLPWITNVEYLAAVGVTSQFSRERKYQGSAGFTPYTLALEDGEFGGELYGKPKVDFTPEQYYSDVKVHGLPVDAQARVTANQFGKYGIVTNKVLLGFEWKMQGNSGRGKEFDLTCPPSPGSSEAFRARSYRDIPYLHRITAFLEDNFKIGIGKTNLEIQAGARLNAISAEGVRTKAFFGVEPRLNARYEIIRKRTGWRELGIRGGWGISYKMPSMVYLYPEPAYKDMISFNYNDFNAGNGGLAVMTTKKLETANPALLPQKTRNIEAGIDFDAGVVSGSVVYFNEHMTNGYGFVTEMVPMEYRRYGYTLTDGNMVQDTRWFESGKNPKYNGTSLKEDGAVVPYAVDTTFMQFSRPTNGIENRKWGVEFTLDFAKIKAINTSISVSGSYMCMESIRTGRKFSTYLSSAGGRSFPYAGIYAGDKDASNGSVKDRFSTNVRFITHIPRLAMVVTLTAQMVFLDRSRSTCTFDGTSLPYFYDEGGKRISGAEAVADTQHTKYINPLYIMDRSGEVIPFTQEMERNDAYRNLIITTNTSTFYVRQNYPFYAMLNLRLSKQIKDIATISFYANNFLNLKGRVKNSVTGYPMDKNTPIYFGAEVKISIK